MKSHILTYTIALSFLFCAHDYSWSQLCTPAQATGPGYYHSVDPPTFTFTPPSGMFCNFVEIGNALPADCPWYFLIGCTNGTAGVTETCIVLSNSQWNYCYSPNVQYCYKIHTNGAGNTWQAGSDNIMRLPGALPNVSLIFPVNGSSGISLTPMIKWSHIDSASNYALRIYTDKCCLNVILDSSTVSDSIRVSPGKLNWNTTYWWRVKPYKAGGEGPISDPFSFTTSPPQAPPAPGLSLPANNSTGLPLTNTLSWNASAGATSYRLQVSTNSGFSAMFLDDSLLTGTSRVVPGLSPLTTYYWRAYAKNSAGISSWSATWNFRTMGPSGQVTLLSPPNNSNNVPTSNTFLWSKAYDLTTKLSVQNYWYEIVTDTVSYANLLRDSTLIDTLRTISGMGYNTSYYWRVKAKNQIGWGVFSAWFKFTTVPMIPGAPSLIAPPNNATNIPTTYTFIWSKPSEQFMHLTVSKYWLEMTSDTITNANYLGDSTITDTLRSVGGMLPGTSYYWRVKAKNQLGWGNFSLRRKFTTVPPVPSAPILIAPANNSTGQSLTPLLDWQVAQYAASYRLQLSTDTLFSVIRLDSTISADSIRIPSGKLMNNTTYYWRVNASNSAGTSSWSTVWHFTTLYLGINNIQGELPGTFKLYSNYPNPFNPTTRIRFDVPVTSYVTLQIFDVTGKSIAEILNSSSMLPGAYEFTWDAGSYASGVYYYRMTAGDFAEVRKMVLIK